MACTITIGGILAFRSGSNPPHRIELSGTAQDCTQVCATVENFQNGAVTQEVSAQVNSSGQWTAVFTVDDGHFGLGDFTCGNDKKLIARAHCCADPSCQAPDGSFDMLECRDVNATCPTVSIATPDVGPCDTDGTRNVSFTATVGVDPSIAPAVGQWKFDGDDGPTEVLSAGTQTVSTTHDYPGDGGSHTVRFDVVLPQGCGGAEVSFDVGSCAVTPACPQVGTPTATVAGACNADGTRTVTLTATVGAADGDDAMVQWMHDGAFGQAAAVSGTQTITTTHAYPGDGGSHTAAIEVVSPSGCSGSSVEFRVPECPAVPVCPMVAFTDIEVADECDDNDQKHVKVKAEVAPGSDGNIAATLELLDGNSVIATLDSGSASGSTLTLEGETDLDPGDNYQARVTVTSPQGCPGASTEVEVPPCDSTPPPDDDTTDDSIDETTSGFDICSILRFLIIFGVGLATIGLVLLVCPLIAAPLISSVQTVMIIGGILLGLGLLIAVIAAVAWFFICQPSVCAWMLLLWQVLFIAGVLATFAAFCPACVWFGLGVILLGGALTAFATWILRCRPTTCTIYAELLLVMIVFDICAVLEYVLGSCVIVSNPIAGVLWALGIAAFNTIVYLGLRRNNCLVTG